MFADIDNTRLVDGEWTDEDIQDPLEQMMALLSETRDRMLIQRWGLWLVKRDASAGLKVYIASVRLNRGLYLQFTHESS
jgi:hypothetical protein